jgi:type I restriction enzyme R subunit
VACPDLRNEFDAAVIGALESHNDLSTQILSNSEISPKLLGEFVPIIYRALKPTA